LPRILQIDQVFDLPGGELCNSRRLLRLRSSGGTSILTYKGPPLPGPYKSREELEVSVFEQPSSLADILDRLGYVPAFRYEKYRTTYSADQDGQHAVVVLDETPIGVFLELEGPEYWIDRTASTLGFSPTDYITNSYASLYQEHRRSHGGSRDMRFT
jgi:adenylate cyclase class 2